MPRKKKEVEPAPSPTNVVRSQEQARFALRKAVRAFYDIQRLRMQVAGRLAKRPAGQVQDILHEADVKLLESRFAELERLESELFSDVEAYLWSIPFYRDCLRGKIAEKRYPGFGVTMAAVLLAEVDIVRAENVSKLWRYCGLATVPCRRCVKCGSVWDAGAAHVKSGLWGKCDLSGQVFDVSQTRDSSKREHPVPKEKLHYNSFLKTKMVGVMGSNLLKAGGSLEADGTDTRSQWRKVYDGHKHFLVSGGRGRNDGHRHQMAIGKMVKMLLLDIWVLWREFEGLPARPSYQEEKLGHKHHAA